MVKISARLRGSQNLHNTLQPLPVQLSEAVMEMQERGVTVSNKVRSLYRCILLKSSSASIWINLYEMHVTSEERCSAKVLFSFVLRDF